MNLSLEIIVAWGPTLLEVRHLRLGERFTLGEGSPFGGTESVIPPGHCVTIAAVEADGPRIWLPEGISGVYEAGGTLTPLPAEQHRTLVLGREGRLRAEAGALTLYIQVVEAAAAPEKRSLKGMGRDLRGIAGAAVLHAAFLLTAIMLPPDGQALSMDQMDIEPGWVHVSAIPMDSKEKDLFKRLDEPRADRPMVEEPGEAVRNERQPSGSLAGEPTAPRRPTGGMKTLDERRAAAGKVASELTSVMDGDLLGGGNPLGRSAMAALVGISGGMPGTGVAMNGSPWGGMGVPGNGPTGPGVSMGPGAIRTRTGRPGPVTRGPGERPDGAPSFKVVPETPQLTEDGLTKDEVQRVVRLKQAEYRYCYERALQTRPELEGKVALKFVVGPQGNVLAASVVENTVADPTVGSCIAEKARRWRFPAPRGGGVVAVKYPFMFRRS